MTYHSSKVYSRFSPYNHDGKLNRNIIKIITMLLIIFLSLSLYGCDKEAEPEFVKLEGESENWTASTNIPYVIEDDDKYFKVTFISSSVDNIFSENDIIAFAIGTSIGSEVFSYSEINGYIRYEYSPDPIDLERIIRVSDDTFEVLYDIDIINTTQKKVDDQLIYAIAVGEKVELTPAE